jgi:hypothetical protein
MQATFNDGITPIFTHCRQVNPQIFKFTYIIINNIGPGSRLEALLPTLVQSMANSNACGQTTTIFFNCSLGSATNEKHYQKLK